MWPIAARKRRTSSGSVAVCVSCIGSNSRVRIALSHTSPVATSITRPRSEKPVLQYDIVPPSGWTWSSSAQLATYFSSASSPRPVSAKLSPSIPLECVSRWRIVTASATLSSATRSSGR